jgi:hypothetical protein
MDKALTWFIRSWLVLVLLANVAAVVGFFLGAATVWDGWMQVKETYSPFNISNFVMEMVSLSPALGALYWRDRRRAAGAQRRSFPIGEYKLDAIVNVTSLTEFSSAEYSVMGREFEGEKNYNAPPVTFLNRVWKLQLGTVNGKIYKIAPFLEFENRQDADLVTKGASPHLNKPFLRDVSHYRGDDAEHQQQTELEKRDGKIPRDQREGEPDDH